MRPWPLNIEKNTPAQIKKGASITPSIKDRVTETPEVAVESSFVPCAGTAMPVNRKKVPDFPLPGSTVAHQLRIFTAIPSTGGRPATMTNAGIGKACIKDNKF